MLVDLIHIIDVMLTRANGVAARFKKRDEAQRIAGIRAAEAEAKFQAEEARKRRERAEREASRELDRAIDVVASVVAQGQMAEDSDMDTDEEEALASAGGGGS